MDEVSGAVVAIAIVLTAVFVPTALISGITGQFYRQFALTIAVATVISAFNSLTLSPALAAMLLRPRDAKKDFLTRGIEFLLGWFFRLFNKTFDAANRGYTWIVQRLIRFSVFALLVYAGLLVLTGVGFKTIPTGFIPTQDQGYLFCVAQLPDGASLQRTDAVRKQISEVARKVPGVGVHGRNHGPVRAGFHQPLQLADDVPAVQALRRTQGPPGADDGCRSCEGAGARLAASRTPS